MEPLGDALGPRVFPDGLWVLFGMVALLPTVPLAPVPVAPPEPIEPGVELLDAPAAELPDALPPAAPPPACASAKVLDMASAPASAIVESFMVIFLSVEPRQIGRPFYVPPFARQRREPRTTARASNRWHLRCPIRARRDRAGPIPNSLQLGPRRACIEAARQAISCREVAALDQDQEPGVTGHDTGEGTRVVERAAKVSTPMDDPYKALRTIQTLARVALESDDEELSVSPAAPDPQRHRGGDREGVGEGTVATPRGGMI